MKTTDELRKELKRELQDSNYRELSRGIGISFPTLYKFLNEYGIDHKQSTVDKITNYLN